MAPEPAHPLSKDTPLHPPVEHPELVGLSPIGGQGWAGCWAGVGGWHWHRHPPKPLCPRVAKVLGGSEQSPAHCGKLVWRGEAAAAPHPLQGHSDAQTPVFPAQSPACQGSLPA